MQDGDLFTFMAIFRDLLQVFPKRIDETEIGVMAKAYFHALRRFTIPELQAGADAWTQRGKFFPKPAEWRESIPRAAVVATQALVPLPPAEVAEYLEAERVRWEGETCSCRRCVGAGVNHRFLRYAPETDADGRDARGLIGERVVVRGRWLHGDELRRWYAARDAYMALKDAWLGARAMPKAEVETA